MPTALCWGKYHTVDMSVEVLLAFDVVTSLVICHYRSSLLFFVKKMSQINGTKYLCVNHGSVYPVLCYQYRINTTWQQGCSERILIPAPTCTSYVLVERISSLISLCI